MPPRELVPDENAAGIKAWNGHAVAFGERRDKTVPQDVELRDRLVHEARRAYADGPDECDGHVLYDVSYTQATVAYRRRLPSAADAQAGDTPSLAKRIYGPRSGVDS